MKESVELVKKEAEESTCPLWPTYLPLFDLYLYGHREEATCSDGRALYTELPITSYFFRWDLVVLPRQVLNS